MHEYRKVSLDYLESAPNLLQLEKELPLSPESLFRFFEQTDSWGWAGIETVIWTSDPPYNSDTTRTIIQPGGSSIDEQFVLWEQDHRMVFRLERGDVWLLGALIEDYTVTSIGERRCKLTWTIGFEFRGLLKILNPILAVAARSMFQKMLSELAESLNAPE